MVRAHWPTDVLGAYALGGLLLVLMTGLYQRAEAALGSLPLIHAAPLPHDGSVPHAHALTSLVLFDGPTVQKVYAPGLVPRALYWLAFQAPFPYIANIHALRAAMHRRNLAAMLTEYWYGSPRVARVAGIGRTESGYALISEFVKGHAPTDRAAAKTWLHDLCARFEDAGLPTWQIDPRQPRAVDNVLETEDRGYMIVDLESGLVAPLASPKAWMRAFRRGLVPLYDEVFFDLTRAHVARDEAGLRAALGERRFRELHFTLDAAESETDAWHRSEPRVWSRLVRGFWSGFGVRSWPRRIRQAADDGRERAQGWITEAVDRWQAEDRISADEAARLQEQIAEPAFQAVLPHLGVHLAITVFLRFPFGSITRMTWTTGALATATLRFVLRRISRAEWRIAVSVHSPLVILLAGLPSVGTFAYLTSRPVRRNRLLLRVTADAALSHLPWHLYRRSRLERIILRPRAEPVAAS